jgi:hypothetical protein
MESSTPEPTAASDPSDYGDIATVVEGDPGSPFGAVPGGVPMTFGGIARVARALDVVEATRNALRDELTCTPAREGSVLAAVQRGLCLASGLVASVDLDGGLGRDLESLRLDEQSLSSSTSLTEALVQATALSGLIQGVAPVISLPAPDHASPGATAGSGPSEMSRRREVPPCGYI